MSDLQIATDIVILVCMSLITVALLGTLITALVIKHRINQLHQQMRQKIAIVHNLPFIAKEVFQAARKASHSNG